MTFIQVEKHLSKEEGLRRAIKKIEANTGKPFRYFAAMYNRSTGKSLFFEESRPKITDSLGENKRKNEVRIPLQKNQPEMLMRH